MNEDTKQKVDTASTKIIDAVEDTTKVRKVKEVKTQFSIESNHSFYLINEDSNDIIAALSSLTLDNDTLQLGHGLIDKFQLVKYLRPRSTKDIVNQPDVSKFPKLTLAFDISSRYLSDKSFASVIKSSIGCRVELYNLSVDSIEISILPGDKMGLNSISFNLETNYIFNSINTEMALSPYKGKNLWQTLIFNEIEPNYLVSSDFI